MTAVYRIKHQGAANGQRIINFSVWRTSVIGTSPLTQTEMGEALGIIGLRWQNNVLQLLSSTYQVDTHVMQEVIGYSVEPDPNRPGEFLYKLTFEKQAEIPVTTSITGAIPGDPLPNTVAGVIHLDTGLVGRRKRGRMKLGPFAETQNSGNQMTAGTASALDTQLNAYLASVSIAAGTKTLVNCVLSPTTLFGTQFPGDPYGSSFPTIGHTTALTWGTQRTRKYGTGGG